MCDIIATVTNTSAVVIDEIHYSWALTNTGPTFPADTVDNAGGAGLGLTNGNFKNNTITETTAGLYSLRVKAVSDAAVPTVYTNSTFEVKDDADCP